MKKNLLKAICTATGISLLLCSNAYAECVTYNIESTTYTALEEKVEEKTMYVTSENGLNYRTFPSKQDDKTIVDVLPKGEEVLVLIEDYCNGWSIVNIDDEYYFMFSEFLSEEKPIIQECLYSPSYFKKMGIIYWGGYEYSYYSERVLKGGGLNIPNRHTDENGYVCDGNNRICVASGVLKKGTILPSPFGKELCVYDWCGTGSRVDVYVNW